VRFIPVGALETQQKLKLQPFPDVSTRQPIRETIQKLRSRVKWGLAAWINVQYKEKSNGA
jgi:hypothetical protein